MPKNWKQELKDEFNQLDVVDISPRIQEKIETNTEIKEETHRSKPFLKWGIGFASLCLIIGGGLLLTQKGGSSPIHQPTINNKQAFAFSTFSSFSLLQKGNNLKMRKSLEEGEANQIAKEVKEILPFLESTLLIEKGITVVETEKKEGYAYAEEITITQVEHQEVYTLYYNKTEKVEVDEDEKETKTFYMGEMMYQTATYAFTFEGEIEEEGNEIEKEHTFILYEDKNNYIETKREIENGEEEYGYSIYQNGEEVMSVEIEIEEKKNKIETTLEYESKTLDLQYCFSNETDENGNSYYLLLGKKKTNHSIRITTNEIGNYVFAFYDSTNQTFLYSLEY